MCVAAEGVKLQELKSVLHVLGAPVLETALLPSNTRKALGKSTYQDHDDTSMVLLKATGMLVVRSSAD